LCIANAGGHCEKQTAVVRTLCHYLCQTWLFYYVKAETAQAMLIQNFFTRSMAEISQDILTDLAS